MNPAVAIRTHTKAHCTVIYLWSFHVDGLTAVWELWGSRGPLCCGVCLFSCQVGMYCCNGSLIAMSCLQPLLPRPAHRTKANSYRFRYCQILGFLQFMLRWRSTFAQPLSSQAVFNKTRNIQGGARNVVPLIIHNTFIVTEAFDIWYRINPHRLENCS